MKYDASSWVFVDNCYGYLILYKNKNKPPKLSGLKQQQFFLVCEISIWAELSEEGLFLFHKALAGDRRIHFEDGLLKWLVS